jgi:hypothetical protein
MLRTADSPRLATVDDTLSSLAGGVVSSCRPLADHDDRLLAGRLLFKCGASQKQKTFV